MAEALKKGKNIYTYSDYALWPDEERWEIIHGEAYNMAPGASDIHQDTSGELYLEFGNYLRGKTCRVYHPPFDVILPEEGETFETASNIVQPDITVICDKNKITKKGCFGAPDLIIEILSPSSARRDTKDKRRLYQKFGVKEYWIADPVHKKVDVYRLGEDGKYKFPDIYAGDDKIKVGIFNNELEIDLAVIFRESEIL